MDRHARLGGVAASLAIVLGMACATADTALAQEILSLDDITVDLSSIVDTVPIRIIVDTGSIRADRDNSLAVQISPGAIQKTEGSTDSAETKLVFVSRVDRVCDRGTDDCGAVDPYFTLDLYGDGLVQFSVDMDTYIALVGESDDLSDEVLDVTSGKWLRLSADRIDRLLNASTNTRDLPQATAAREMDDGTIELSIGESSQ